MLELKRPFFKYAGSKWQLSRYYPKPVWERLIEPFAGSACYATRHHERQVTLVEKDPEIAALWRYLIMVDPFEIAALPTEELREGQDIRDLSVSFGARLLIRQWQRVGMSNCWTISKWCNKPGQWGKATRDYIARAVESIRHWEVLEGDALGLHNAEATWFIDAPYQGLPLYGSKSIDYARLADWCRTRYGQIIVCEQASATWLPFKEFRVQANRTNGSGKPGRGSHEGIWTNQ